MELTEIEHALREVTGYVNGIAAAQAEQEHDLPTAITEWPCPDVLWQGLFAQIADRLKNRSWEVWFGTVCALGATAHKNLCWQYHRPLYGMIYGLLVSPTGQGKGLCADLCHALLPEFYTVRDSVQSGPALFPILAKIERNAKGKITTIVPRPAILIIEEWTMLLKSSKIEFSNLQETLNNLFHRTRAWNVSRSDTEKSGGDRLVDNPTLSLCATTTESLLREQVTGSMIRSGFLNRYLIIPGSQTRWRFYDEDMAGIDVGSVRGFLDHLVSRTFGGGRTVWLAYTDDAKERMAVWGTAVFDPLMSQHTLEAESLKRLHTYAHIIALLYAWSAQATQVQLSHVEAAIAVIAISKAFVEQLIGNAEVEIPKFKQYEMSLENKILRTVHAQPHRTLRDIAASLRGSGSYPDIVKSIRQLIAGNLLVVGKKGKSEMLTINQKIVHSIVH